MLRIHLLIVWIKSPHFCLKLQVLALSLTFVLVLLTSSLVAVPSVRAVQAVSLMSLLSGTLPLLGPYSFDLCDLILFGLVSCSVTLSLEELYSQNVTLQVQNSPDQLQMNTMESTSVVLSADQPAQFLQFSFTYSGTTYNYKIPIPSVQVPGNIQLQIPIGYLLANFLTGGLIGTIFSHIASLNLDLNFTSEIQGVLTSNGFASTPQLLEWNGQTMNSFSSSLATSTNDASIAITGLDAIIGLSALLSLKLPLISPINLIGPISSPSLTLGSSKDLLPLADWYRVSIESPYSQPTGSGWYLAGTQATFTVADTTIPGQDGNYKFAGWTGTGTGSYTGNQQSETFTATGPANETANWNYVPNPQNSPNTPNVQAIQAGMGWILGGVIAVGLIAIATVMVIVLRRPKPV